MDDMRIGRIHVYCISLPFSSNFSHSLRKRAGVSNIIVEVVTDHGGSVGYGEGAPRSYVTGETPSQCMDSIAGFTRRKDFPWDLSDISQVWDFIDALAAGKEHNAAVCALETALLDAFGRYRGKNIVEFFPKDFYTETIYYGTAIPLDSKQRVAAICQLIKTTMGIRKLKLKMGTNFIQNKEALEAIRKVFGEDYDLKVDINGVWNYDLAFRHLPLIEDFNVRVVEEPMMPDEPGFYEFADHLRKLDVYLMADEAACSLRDVEKIVREDSYTMVNVRLSKCGGFRKSCRMVDFLRKEDMVFQIACHLGESGILSAAGRALSLLCKDAVYHDGSYDEFLLKENTTDENVSFGSGGKAGPLKEPGLGVNGSRNKIERLSKDNEKITLTKP